MVVSFARKKQTGQLKYDPFLRDYVLDSSGAGVNIHPVDQRVAILLGIPQGSFLPDVTVGNPINSIKRIVGDYEDRVIDSIRLTLKDLIDNGDIELLEVIVEKSKNPSSRAYIGVFYKNLRLETPEIQKVTV